MMMATVAPMSDTPPPPPPYLPPPGPPGMGGPIPAVPPTYGGQTPQYSYAGMPSDPPSRSGKALAGFILGLASILLFITIVVPVLALIFGLLGAKDIKKSAGRLKGMGLARAGWILGLLGLLAGVLVIVIAAVGASGSTTIDSLKTGDCVDLPDDETESVSKLTDRSCTEVHDAEVFATGDLPGGDDDYPGVSDVREQSLQQCADDFEDYVGASVADTDLSIFPIYPSEDTWEDYQGYVCLATPTDGGTLTESVEGSAG
jgi:hypothetical protein